MDEALNTIRDTFYDVSNPEPVSDEEWQQFLNTATVGLWAGGLGKRFRHIIGQDNVNKNAHRLPNGKSMIEMTTELYANAGFKHFVAFVNHAADSIKDVLGDGSKFGDGVEIEYIMDPGPVGRSGALLNALNQGVVKENRTLITVNVDDLIFDFEDYPRHLATAHIQGAKKGNIVTLGTYPSRDFPGSALMVSNNQVAGIGFHIQLPVPIHIGTTVFSPEAFEYFRTHASLDREVDFETDILPILVDENKLGAASFPEGVWIPVNEEKMYLKLIDYLDKQVS